ncbi:hypothetical protein ACFQAV_07280 [Companilactobacillus huachuanensis]|uniref:Restriction endonuclease n=1 Tax=Companilactobacillus huachuanensis TaxID=2559914 RepID=A0ABW1RND4_9LACO|nr:hypothetical protein [Companilactobacillus huachuanensis]
MSNTINIINLLKNKGYIDDENDISNKSYICDSKVLELEKQTDDDFFKYYCCDFTQIETFDKDDLSDIFNLVYQPEHITFLFMIFKNRNDEIFSQNDLIKGCNNAKEKRKINDLFNFKTSIYSDNNDNLKLKVDHDGINYLEYGVKIKYDGLDFDSEINSKVFNVSMFELQRLFNVTGSSLFDLNIRTGIENKKAGKELKENFKRYLEFGIINYPEFIDEKNEILGIIGNPDGDEMEDSYPELFWFCHNGINIFVNKKSEHSEEANYVSFNPNEVSVINGAQTLTNFFNAKEELISDLSNLEDLTINSLNRCMDSILKKIILKTVFIFGDKKISKQITWGLNNQIPIKIEDFEGASDLVDEINNKLKKYQMKILRTGQENNILTTFTPLEFAKKSLAIDNRPGRSKNFKKSQNNIDEVFGEVLHKLKSDASAKRFIDNINVTMGIDKWWRDKSKSDDEKSNIIRYGKIYFQSYVINDLNSIDDEDDYPFDDLDIKYDEFEKYAQNLHLEANDFKTDEKFEEILKQYNTDKEENKNNENIEDTIKELNEFVKNMKKESAYQNNYSTSYLIKKFYDNNKIKIGYFRTIPFQNGNVKESFPLPNSSFDELYKRDGYNENDNYLPFNKSNFFSQLKREYPIFIIYYSNNLKINNIEYMKMFSLNPNKSESLGESVYYKTIDAFKKGDIKEFPKVSDHKKFHVRPKARNGNDTFEFTDGTEITKRTFWANSEYIQELIESKKE